MSDEACYADDIGDYRWEGFPLEEKVAWMRDARGSAAVAPCLEALRGLSARYAESHTTVQAGLAKLGVSWQGQSADAAGHAVTRLADWVGGAGRTVADAGGSMGTYGASFDAMRPHLSLPPPMPSVGPRYQPADGAGVLAGLQSAIRQQADATAAADAQANAALRAHQQATRAALAAFPLAQPPPEVTAAAVSGARPAGGAGGGAGADLGAAAPRAGGVGVGVGGAWAGGAAGAGTAAAGGGGSAGHAGAGSVGAGAAGAGSAAGGHQSTGSGPGGTTAAGAAPAAPAPTADGGWTPLSPPSGGPSSGSGLMTGPNGGLVPASVPPPYRPFPDQGAPTGLGAPMGANGTAGSGRYGVGTPGRPGGYGETAPPLAPRTGAGPVRPQFGGDFGVPQNAPGRGAGFAGAAPVGMAGGPGAGQERTRRNEVFVPSDEPFRVEFPEFTPPVLGVREPDAW